MSTWRYGLRILAITLMLMAVRAHASCDIQVANHKDAERWFSERWLVTYDGDLDGTIPIRMTLVFDGNRLTGRYFYTKYFRNIDVRGSVRLDRGVELNELDDAGATKAVFSGHFMPSDPRGYYRGDKLTCEVLVGTWTETATGRALPFYLQLRFANVGQLGNRYRTWSGTKNDEASVESVAIKFVQAFRDDERAAVAAMLRYPLHVQMEDGTVRAIQNRAQLLPVYDQAFPQYLRDSIQSAIPMHMPLGKYELIRIGRISGPWIGPDMKIWLNGANP